MLPEPPKRESSLRPDAAERARMAERIRRGSALSAFGIALRKAVQKKIVKAKSPPRHGS